AQHHRRVPVHAAQRARGGTAAHGRGDEPVAGAASGTLWRARLVAAARPRRLRRDSAQGKGSEDAVNDWYEVRRAVYARLDALGIPYRIARHAPATAIEQCGAIGVRL